MSQKFRVHSLERRKDKFMFDGEYDEDYDKDGYVELMLSIRRSYTSYTVIRRSYSKEWKSKNAKNSCVISMTRKNYVTHIKALKLSMKHRLKLKKYTG